MARMFGFQLGDFPELSQWFAGELPKVPHNTRVWDALLHHSPLTDAGARQAIRPDTDPFYFVEDIPGQGLFSPGRPRTISLALRLVNALRASPNDPGVLQLVEATVLHEMVHWAWAAAGKPEMGNDGFPAEKGSDFEAEAYAGGLPKVGEPPRRIPDAREDLGELSREYESRGNPGAIGHDSTGGWSYGSYQLASKLGRVQDFLDFLRREAPASPAYRAILDRLENAGGDRDARRGAPVFCATWRALGTNPAFVVAQHEYIKRTHYDPFSISLRRQGIDLDQRSHALRTVAWSISVQHGPGATNLFTMPFAGLPPAERVDDSSLIKAIYRERSRVDVYFRRSTPQVRQAVLRRFENELARALAMLRQ